MFAALHAPSCPAASFTGVARDFTPRFEVLGDVLLLDVSGLARLFGSPVEIGESLHRAAAACVRDVQVAVAPTATAAMLLVLGRTGPCVVTTTSEMASALAALPLSVLGEYERIRSGAPAEDASFRPSTGSGRPESVEGREAKPSGLPSERRERGRPPEGRSSEAEGRGPGGWAHPRNTHQAQRVRRSPRRPIGAAARQARSESLEIDAMLGLLARWGLTTLGAFEALPRPDVAERLGDRGTRWQRLAGGEDEQPLVPWVAEVPFEASIDLEWPIEGLEPLSFVLTRLLEPLAGRLERADRGAAVLHLRLGLVTKGIHARHVHLPAPMREPKTLRTLMLLDLESHPPAAAVDRIGVLIDPTPGRVLQWTLFERAQPSPEQVATLLARLVALMGEGHVGSPRLVDSWKPGAFELNAFHVPSAEGCGLHASAVCSVPSAVHAPPAPGTLHSCVRRFRLPVPARVRVHEGRPVRVQVDRRGLASGAVVQSAGPWRSSGEWWQASSAIGSRQSAVGGGPSSAVCRMPSAGRDFPTWDRDEWDVALGDGTIYRLFVEREIGQWFIEGVID